MPEMASLLLLCTGLWPCTPTNQYLDKKGDGKGHEGQGLEGVLT